MNMIFRIRTLFFYTIISVIVLFLALLSFPIKAMNTSYSFRYKICEIFSYIFIYLMWIICGIKYELEGREKLPKDGKPHLVLANHQSFWENFFMQLIIPEHSWVIKREIESIPFFGLMVKAMNTIAVDRSNSQSVAHILREGSQKINSGLSLIMFPESTRIKVGKNVPFKPSAAKLAINTGVPIILIVHNAGIVWPKGFWFKQPGTVKVKIIECISPKQIAQMEVRELNTYIQERINHEKDKLIT